MHLFVEQGPISDAVVQAFGAAAFSPEDPRFNFGWWPRFNGCGHTLFHKQLPSSDKRQRFARIKVWSKRYTNSWDTPSVRALTPSQSFYTTISRPPKSLSRERWKEKHIFHLFEPCRMQLLPTPHASPLVGQIKLCFLNSNFLAAWVDPCDFNWICNDLHFSNPDKECQMLFFVHDKRL